MSRPERMARAGARFLLGPRARTAPACLSLAALVVGLVGCKRDKGPSPGTDAAPAGPVVLPFRDPALPLEQRIADLMGRLTLEEKIAQLQNAAPAIERLDIPAYDWWNEALHGVGRAGTATVFPQPIGLAATFDADLIQRVADAISDEARAKHHRFADQRKHGRYMGLTFWTPNINLFRDPRWGRGMETLGEDPFLTGRLAAAFVRGLQGADPKYLKTVATPKHFAVHSGPEPLRHSFDAQVSAQELADSYLPHFREAIVAAGARSTMCAYNRVLGEPACASQRLLGEVLREQWRFDGYVVSDCWAVDDIYKAHEVVKTPAEAVALALKAGTDLECGSLYAKHLGEAISQGLASEADVDRALRRLLAARFALGQFDPPGPQIYAAIPYSVVASDKHDALALEAARKSIVLLQHARAALPLRKDVRRIAVVGPVAIDPFVAVGNYHGTSPRMTRILEALRAKVPQAEVDYAPGASIAEGLPALRPVPAMAFFHQDAQGQRAPGLRAQYFNTTTFEELGLDRVVPEPHFHWGDGAPDDKVREDGMSVRMEGLLVPEAGGRHLIGVRSDCAYRVEVGGKVLAHEGNRDPDEAWLRYLAVDLKAGSAVPVKIELVEHEGDASFQLSWGKVGDDARLNQQALDVARRADVVIAILGLTPWLEGEEMPVAVPGFAGGDRKTLDLPRPQQALLDKLLALRKPTALVLTGGSALAVDTARASGPFAMLHQWYPGQAGARALADVLFGDYAPGGRLPVTFYKSVAQLPPFESYAMKGRTYRYFTGAPAFPFGHGLSYTRFVYSDLVAPKQAELGEEVALSVTVENAGPIDGDEVIQVYLRHLEPVAGAPLRALKGFQRVRIRSGNRHSYTLRLRPEDLAQVDPEGRRVLRPGRVEIVVAGKQPPQKGVPDTATSGLLAATLELTGAEQILPPR